MAWGVIQHECTELSPFKFLLIFTVASSFLAALCFMAFSHFVVMQ